MKKHIPIYIRLALTLERLRSGNMLMKCAHLNVVAYIIPSIFLRECCEGIKSLVRPLVFNKINFAYDFENISWHFICVGHNS